MKNENSINSFEKDTCKKHTFPTEWLDRKINNPNIEIHVSMA